MPSVNVIAQSDGKNILPNVPAALLLLLDDDDDLFVAAAVDVDR